MTDTMASSGPSTTGDPGTAMTDEDLLAAAARGDQEAIGHLYDRHQGSMYGLAMRITGDPALAQDVVQEAMVGVWRNAPRFDGDRASGRTWILSITHHRAIDVLRRRRSVAPMPDPEVAPPAALVLPDIWQDVVGRLDAAAGRSALDRLSEVQREALELAYFGGCTQQEIAARTGAPLGTVKGRIRLGLSALRAELSSLAEDVS